MADRDEERERLINTIDKSMEDGLALLEEIATDSPEARVGDWSARDVLCHMVYYHEVAVEGWEAIRRGGPPYRFDVHVDELNARIIAREAGKTTQELIAEIRRLHVLYLNEARIAPDLDAVGVVRWDDSTSTIRQRLVSKTSTGRTTSESGGTCYGGLVRHNPTGIRRDQHRHPPLSPLR